jgi:glycosyltransferase involved in cell wall biosynthesis
MQKPGRPLRLVHVIAGLDPAHGGPSYSVPRLCQALVVAGTEPVLLSVAAARDPPCDTSRCGYPDRRFAQDWGRVPGLRALRFSSALSRALREAVAAADLVHDHGLWLSPNLQAGWAAAAAGKPFVVSTRGMLSPPALAFSRLKKRVFWTLLQASAIRRAACIHATSAEEYEELREFGLRQPIAVIPNGIDLPEAAPAAPERDAGDRVLLSLGRVHPKKGLETLLQAWARVEPAHADWRLSLVGPGDEGYVRELRAMARTLGLGRVFFGEPVFGAAKWDVYRAADLFVLPSLNENFGLTVAEALAAGRPVIASTGTPWGRVESEGCGWRVEPACEAIAAALATAMALPRAALQRMGSKGRAWMARDFSWDRVAGDMGELYSWVVGRAERPPSVRFQ